ncbi:MAG: 2-oxoglutarate dehydrogenase complex dihydrolipoyllysine-residue succinyltransferase [Gammaproteobacteria bacterium]|nr:2-oxoglutarate dehydrogenase complex dihydrolipoyllysine-residue succinyltransferase [Gammaproteobacteria bacterium]MCH9744935.1 2-oxoglutarate dehydrogenase complex dihydrolipoyllysine-residue succinyltransferase [Gammaproteobacteria bacterium]
MTIEIKVPVLPESVTDATVAKWYKKVGDSIARDENLVDLETDKVMLEVPAPRSGTIETISVKEGDVVTASQVLATIKEGEVAAAASAPAAQASVPEQKVASAPAATASSESLSPSARRAVSETGVDVSQVSGTGRDGRITKQDVTQQLSQQPQNAVHASGHRSEKRVPMSRLRQRIAERLVAVQHEAAILTTFNEIDMLPVMNLRKKYKEKFEKEHGVKLGFMSFFTKAVIEALKKFPAVNASIDGTDVIYHNYYDIGVAIGSPRGLVVPILRNAESMNMAAIEKNIKDFALRAKDGKLSMEEMTGGTFTITNGGTYGSMMSTPIINPPQTGILGMHNIVERAVVVAGEIVVRPMMYVALSYDHRVIDGSESVRFLVTIKEMLEDPTRMLIEV